MSFILGVIAGSITFAIGHRWPAQYLGTLLFVIGRLLWGHTGCILGGNWRGHFTYFPVGVGMIIPVTVPEGVQVPFQDPFSARSIKNPYIILPFFCSFFHLVGTVHGGSTWFLLGDEGGTAIPWCTSDTGGEMVRHWLALLRLSILG